MVPSDVIGNFVPVGCRNGHGFYGKPWSKLQRKDLFKKMKKMELSTYLYAPKDDHKHRLFWRDLYNDKEAAELRELIAEANAAGHTFVYAISPGLDISYSSKDDVQKLLDKMKQVQGYGCTSWALLFDDIEVDMSDEDVKRYKTLGQAQAELTNNIYKSMKNPNVFLFCPTEYCASRAVPNLKDSDYLKHIGDTLVKDIDILWTGQKVVTREISVEATKDVNDILKRKVVIWDNIHANDYDQTRLYLGAYEGRPPGLRDVVRGVFTNPNCEYEANFVAMHTLSQWSQNRVCCFYENDDTPRSSPESSGTSDSDMETENCSSNGYNPSQALVCAVKDWRQQFYIHRSHDGIDQPKDAECTRASLSPDRVDLDSPNSPGSNEEDMDTNGRKTQKTKVRDLGELDKEDLLLLCDLFYLPFRDGERAGKLLELARWLMDNTDLVRECDQWNNKDPEEQRTNAKDWYDRAINFHDRYKKVAVMVDKFVNVPNRVLLYELYNYISDMRSVISMLNSTIKWHGLGEPNNDPPYTTGEQEPWVRHGGLHAKFWRMLPMDPPPSKKFLIRPYLETDKAEIYQICRFVGGEQGLGNVPEIMGDELVGGLLKRHPGLCYVLEVNDKVSGFLVATPSLSEYWEWWRTTWLPEMQKKYPEEQDEEKISDLIHTYWHQKSEKPPTENLQKEYPGYLQMAYRGHRVQGWHEIKCLMNVVLQQLKSTQVTGVHTVIRTQRENMQTKALYQHLGFEVLPMKSTTRDELIMVRKIEESSK